MYSVSLTVASCGCSHSAVDSSSHSGKPGSRRRNAWPIGVSAALIRASSWGVSSVAVDGSTGTITSLRHGERITMLAASGSQRMLNSRRGALTNSRANCRADTLSRRRRGLRLPPM